MTVVVLGHEITVSVFDATSDEQAKSLVIDEASKSFHVRAVTAVRPKKRTSLLSTYIDGFKLFFQNIFLAPVK